MITKTVKESRVIEVKVTKNYATFSDLEDFLTSRGALKYYILNLAKANGLLSLDLKKTLIQSGLVSENFISGAFVWDITKEGEVYWIKLNEEFTQWLEKNNIEGFVTD